MYFKSTGPHTRTTEFAQAIEASVQGGTNRASREAASKRVQE
jgi:hypothetical protein